MINAGPSLEQGEIPDAAQGVIGRDGNTVYQIAGRGDAFDGAQVVSLRYVPDAEGAVILERLNGGDPEDTEPTPVEDGSVGEIMTRAELTAKVKQLETENADLNAQIELLLSGVME